MANLRSMPAFLWLCSIFSAVAFGAVPRRECLSQCNGGHDEINLKKFPGYNGPVIQMNSGFIEVNKSANGSMFYWLIQSMNAKEDTPLVIWLNGGPGASSLTGLFAENGPFRINSDLSLEFFNGTWAKHYHLLFVDNPIDTGFSFCSQGQQIQNEDQMGQNFAVFMKEFYRCHSKFANKPLFISGESYAGRYIPFIAYYLRRSQMKVAGLAIGNGIYDPFLQFPSAAQYALVNGILDEPSFEAVSDAVTACLDLAREGAEQNSREILNESAAMCLDAVNGIYEGNGGGIFQYDIRKSDGGAFDQISNDIAAYLNQSTVAEEIHSCGVPWKSSDGTSSPNAVADALNYDIMLNNTAWMIPGFLSDGIRILFYNGQFDGSVCNNFGNQQCLQQLNYRGEWNALEQVPLFLDGKCIGYSRVSSDGMLSYVVVRESGHLVPYDAPEAIMEILREWIEA